MAEQTEYAIMMEPLSVEDGGGWLATVPALPGCTGDGETREGALNHPLDPATPFPQTRRTRNFLPQRSFPCVLACLVRSSRTNIGSA